MNDKLYEITDENGNAWSIGLKDIRGKGKLSGYIKLNDFEFILANFNTQKSANVWWEAFNSMLNKGK